MLVTYETAKRLTDEKQEWEIYLVCNEGKSPRFYLVVGNTDQTAKIHYGKVGCKGRTLKKTFSASYALDLVLGKLTAKGKALRYQYSSDTVGVEDSTPQAEATPDPTPKKKQNPKLIKVKTFDEAEIRISRYGNSSKWYEARDSRRGHHYSVIYSGSSVQEILADARKDGIKTYLIDHEHRCEAPGCTTKSEYGYCVHHHFTKVDGTPRRLGILALPLEKDEPPEGKESNSMKIKIYEDASKRFARSVNKRIGPQGIWMSSESQYYETMKKLDGMVVEVETDILFAYSFNVAPVPGVTDHCVGINADLVAEVINDARIGKYKCGYCGKITEDIETTCPKCHKTEYMSSLLPGSVGAVAQA